MKSNATNLRRAQLHARAPRALFYAFVTIFCLVGLKSMFGSADATPVRAPSTPPADWSATAYAQAFAREYLTWGADEEPTDRQERLAPFLADDLDPSGGVVPGKRADQRVKWTTVMGVARNGDHQVVTVEAGTSSKTVYLAVPVLRDAERRLAIAAYPAFVGPPATSTAVRAKQETDVDDTALNGVVERALRNYLSGSRDDLLADLTDDAVVSPPQQRLTLTSVEQLIWVKEPRRVAAEVTATDERGTRLRLRYELDVQNDDGRWFVRSVHIDPTYGGSRP